jgi:hypothetical protein
LTTYHDPDVDPIDRNLAKTPTPKNTNSNPETARNFTTKERANRARSCISAQSASGSLLSKASKNASSYELA